MRSDGILKFLLMISISVGKIAYTVRKKRQQRAFKVLSMLRPFIRRWVSKHRVHLMEMITEMVETSLSMDTFYKIIASWKQKVVTVQRCVKHWLLRRRAHVLVLLACWNHFELTTGGKGSLKGSESPPDPIKLLFLSEFLKAKMKVHLFDLENWKAKCESILERYEKLVYEMLDDPPPPPKFPYKPKFPTLITREEVTALCLQAEKKKSRWPRMLRETMKIPHKESMINEGPD